MTKIKLIMTVYGDLLDPHYFSKLVKITPTSFWFKGDSIPNRKINLVRKETCWEYSSEFLETLFLEDLTISISDKFNPSIEKISNYITKNFLETKIFLVIEIINKETPAIFFSKEFLEFVTKMNGEIDVDMYVLD